MNNSPELTNSKSSQPLYFRRKGYGRIFTDSEENASKIRDLIREMDEDEFDYLPDDLVAVYVSYDECVYNGKFCDFDLNGLLERCSQAGIPCRVVVAEEYRA